MVPRDDAALDRGVAETCNAARLGCSAVSAHSAVAKEQTGVIPNGASLVQCRVTADGAVGDIDFAGEVSNAPSVSSRVFANRAVAHVHGHVHGAVEVGNAAAEKSSVIADGAVDDIQRTALVQNAAADLDSWVIVNRAVSDIYCAGVVVNAAGIVSRIVIINRTAGDLHGAGA